ncbi:MAG TPA: TauD/TfdA family dioxygenase [Solirubrobacteraceae bacterium]|jgi:L-asparagine oxygenase
MDSTLSAAPPSPAPAYDRAPAVIELTPAECERLLVLAGELSVSPSDAPDLFCRQARRAARRMPDRVADLLADFARLGTETGTLLIQTLPLEKPPPTPADNRSHLGERTLLARVQAIVNHACGEMVAYQAEGHGRLYQDMVPNRALAQSQTSLGSRVELELHTEQAFSSLKPDVLSLACLRGHPDAQTYVLPAHVLLAQLGTFERKLLREPLWMTGVDGSFCQGGHEFIEGDERGPLAIIAGAEDDPTFVFDQDLMRGLTEEAQAMIDRIVHIYHTHRCSHTLKPGQILLLDNVRAVHGRSPFTPNFDGNDRFIIRSFAVRDLVRTRYARPGNGRTIAAEYS